MAIEIVYKNSTKEKLALDSVYNFQCKINCQLHLLDWILFTTQVQYTLMPSHEYNYLFAISESIFSYTVTINNNSFQQKYTYQKHVPAGK